MTSLRPRGPVTRLSPNAKQAAELRELDGARSWQLCWRTRCGGMKMRMRTREMERQMMGKGGGEILGK